MQKSFVVSKSRMSLSQNFSHLGLSEPTWVLIHVWDGRDPDSPKDVQILDTPEQKDKSPSVTNPC